MKFGVVNKSTILNRFVLHTLQRNITHLAVITRKTNIKLGILKKEKSQIFEWSDYSLLPASKPAIPVEVCILFINLLFESLRKNYCSGMCK